ncbi:MAG: SDR family NAD(P)-dependent oxidoreductase, partial [Candidatus Omnitrophica bacterium]|nr:SDR family NAD(P)-dependent oxidoreductase [Candidatus Omnitrophota bacterium]
MVTLKNKKVLVTGGAGFIGSHIVDRLLAEGARVTVLDNLSSGKIENIAHNKNKINFIQKDIRDEAALNEAIKGIELISHQAALRSVP